jgi:uncharacterized protein (TIGR00251 family)
LTPQKSPPRKKKNPSRNKGPAPAVSLSIRIQPRASRNEIVRQEGGGLKIRLTAPPIDGAANEALVKFLADALSVSRSRVEIVSGHTSREKIVRITGMNEAQVTEVLNREDE